MRGILRFRLLRHGKKRCSQALHRKILLIRIVSMRTNLPEKSARLAKSGMKSRVEPVAGAGRAAKAVSSGAIASEAKTNGEKADTAASSGATLKGARLQGLTQERLKKTMAHAHMRRMAPVSVQDEEILPASALMCHIMLLNSVLERSSNRFCEAHGLTFPQWMALGCIGHYGEEGIRHSELGNHLMLSKAPVTGVVDRLERGDFVERRPDAIDRRVSRVVMTPKGEQAWRHVRDTLRERSIGVCEGLSQNEQAQLLGFLARLLEDAARADPILSVSPDDN